MNIFDFLRANKKPEASNSSIHIESIEAQDSISVVMLAVTKGLDCIYLNTYEPQNFEVENQGSASFRGPVYRINLNLTNGENFNIFYGIVTDDRYGMTSSINSNTLDVFCVLILKEVAFKMSGIYDLHKFKNAPTYYTFYLERFPSGYYVTNNSGDDSYFLPFNKSMLMTGDRESILSRIQST